MLAFSSICREDLLPSTPPEIRDYLAKRGVSLDLAQSLGVKVMSANLLMARAAGAPLKYEDGRLAIVFPHYSVRGELLDWWSARLVQSTPTTALRVVRSFADYVDQAQTQSLGGKMTCPPSTPPAAYLPHGHGLPVWADIPNGSRVYFHESVLKAVNGAVLGTYCVGLNGVWGWGSRKHEIALLPEIRDLPWKQKALQPIILFDSNVTSNWLVKEAAIRLAAKLLELTGIEAKLLILHKNNDTDEGFDDFAQRVGPVHAREFLDTLDEDLTDIDQHPVQQLKATLNNRVAFVRSMSRVAELATLTLMTPDQFASANYANFTAEVDTANGGVRTVSVPRLWLADTTRNEVEAIEYVPGGDPLVHDPATGARLLNSWRGWGLQATPGHVDLWLELLTSNVDSTDYCDWILDWLAYPIQNPGAKADQFLLLYGAQGTGKDQFLYPMHLIYGLGDPGRPGNSVKIGSHQLASSFTSVYTQRQFIQVDELKRAKSTEDIINQTVKGIVTNKLCIVNTKNVPEYTVRNRANLALTSNYSDCIKLDSDDRRAGVVKWEPRDPARKADHSYWAKYSAWVDGGGASHIFHYLKTRDISKFNPHGHAPTSTWKEDVIDATRTVVEKAVYDFLRNVEDYLTPIHGSRQIFNVAEIAQLIYNEDVGEIGKGRKDAISRQLSTYGVHKANNGSNVKSKAVAAQYWIIPRKGQTQLDFSSHAACLKHLKVFGL